MEQHKLPPGFRFSPTDEELVMHYLKNRAFEKECYPGVVAEVDIYKHEPWDLPEKLDRPSLDPVWYFFNAQDKRHSHSSRIPRTTSRGYWKATGKDRKICSGPHTVGIKKTLIYYQGRAPRGKRTDWVMHEYKLDEDYEKKSKAICSPALCRIRKKGGPGPRNGEQFGASVHIESNEGVEIVDAAIDKILSSQSAQYSEFTSDFVQPDSMKPKEEASVDLFTDGLGLDDLLPEESVENSTDIDIFVKSLLVEDPYVASVEADMVSSTVQVNRTVHDYPKSNIGHALCTLWDRENEGIFVHDHLRLFTNEEDILRKPQDRAETHVAGSSTQAPLCSDGDPYSYLREVSHGFIEMYDMDSPLDDFVLRSPSAYDIEQQQLSPEMFDKEARFGCPAVLLSTQGSAARRVRLQVTPQSSAIETNLMSREPIEKIFSEVLRSSDITVKADNTSATGCYPGKGSIVSDSDSTAISEMSSLKCNSGKEFQLVKSFDYFNKKMMVKPVTSDAVLLSFPSSLVSKANCLIEGLDCELGCKGKGGLRASADGTSHSNHTQEEDSDCAAGTCSRQVHGKASKLVHTSLNDENKDVGELMNIMKAVTRGGRVVKLESKLSMAFNDKVYALGKSFACLFPANEYMNPYGSLKRGLMGSLCYLGPAALVLYLIYLGIPVITKFALSSAA